MKYLDEKGLEHLWGKIQELSFSGGGGGGEGTPSYFEKTYTEYGFKVANPMHSTTITEQQILETNKTFNVYQNDISIGDFIVKEMSSQECAILGNVLANFGTTGVQITNATYISDVANWMGLLDNSVFGFIIITASASISGMQTNMFLYFTNTKASGEDFFAIKNTIKIPAKKFYEPVLLWEGVSNNHGNLVLNDNATKFRHLAVTFVIDLEKDKYPKVMTSPIIDNQASFNFSSGGGVYLSGNVDSPYEYRMTNTSNVSSIYVTKMYGIY